MEKHSLKIGFDVAQTCHDRAGCGWVADLLVRQMVKLAPAYEFFLYHHFGKWVNHDTTKGTHLDSKNVREPLSGLSSRKAWDLWESIATGAGKLPGDPDIVHANCFQAPLVRPAKLVYTVYDVSFWVHPEFATEENRLFCQRGVLEAVDRAAGLVFISQSSMDEFQRVLPGLLERRGIRHTVAPLASRFEAATQPRGAMPGTCWLAVGSLEPRKNYDRILSAFEIYFENSAVKRQLTIVGGKGWKSEDLRRRIKTLEQRGLIKYEGYVGDSRLCELYSTAFGLVFPSHYEGFGLPIVEAMSQACPVITRRNSSLPEVGG
ncbi:MAG: glycosyltransferase family 4 protein, partial [Verrucomicrobia bacterium]|nr:glycosyltransferase family 4 protein [Verrucomicrobiota bacterium]